FAVVQRERTGFEQPLYAVRHLLRFPPGTAYAAIGATVGETVRNCGLARPPVIADLTAVGPGALRVLRPAIRPAWRVSAMLTTTKTAAKDEDGTWRVPKRDLVTTLQLLRQERRLRIAPALPDADVLVRELTAYRPRVILSPTESIDW